MKFVSLLLVALPECCGGSEFVILPSFTAQSADGSYVDKVDVVALNCETKGEIEPYLEKMLETLRELPSSDVVLHNTMVVKNWLKQIKAGCYEHDVPVGLLKALRKVLGKMVQPSMLVYLSGVVRYGSETGQK